MKGAAALAQLRGLLKQRNPAAAAPLTALYPDRRFPATSASPTPLLHHSATSAAVAASQRCGQLEPASWTAQWGETLRRFGQLWALGLAAGSALAAAESVWHKEPALCETAVTQAVVGGTATELNERTEVGSLPPELLDELRQALGEEKVVLDRDERETHGKPWNSYHTMVALPDAVVYPE